LEPKCTLPTCTMGKILRASGQEVGSLAKIVIHVVPVQAKKATVMRIAAELRLLRQVQCFLDLAIRSLRSRMHLSARIVKSPEEGRCITRPLGYSSYSHSGGTLPMRWNWLHTSIWLWGCPPASAQLPVTDAPKIPIKDSCRL